MVCKSLNTQSTRSVTSSTTSAIPTQSSTTSAPPTIASSPRLPRHTQSCASSDGSSQTSIHTSTETNDLLPFYIFDLFRWHAMRVSKMGTMNHAFSILVRVYMASYLSCSNLCSSSSFFSSTSFFSKASSRLLMSFS
jgi:hypothetical protein